MFSSDAVRAAYDAVAADYVEAFGDDLDSLPLDRAMIDVAVASSREGWSVDLGCGPAQVSAYLAGRSLVGLDLSRAMLVEARSRAPEARLIQADMRSIPFRDRSVALVVAYYSAQHLRRDELPSLLGEVRRVLVPSGVFLVATHLGEGRVTIDEFLGHKVDPISGTMWRARELLDVLRAAGFDVKRTERRQALPHEYPSQRIYIVCGT